MSLEQFDFYLTGLFEGDGHLWLPSTNIEKKANPRFCITTSVKNKPFIEFLQKSLGGYGFIRNKVSENALVLTISNKLGLEIIAKKMNGKFRTPKVHKFYQLLDWLNSQDLSYNFQKLPMDNSSIDKNSWLAGFFDADGCFYIRVSEGLKKNRISIRFTIDQRMYDSSGHSYQPFMQKVADHFSASLTRVAKPNSNSYFHLSIFSLKSANLLDNYLKKNQLLTSKWFDYLTWSEVLFLMNNNQHYQNISNIKFLKSQMNARRSVFDWNFLSSLDLGNAV